MSYSLSSGLVATSHAAPMVAARSSRLMAGLGALIAVAVPSPISTDRPRCLGSGIHSGQWCMIRLWIFFWFDITQ